MNVDHQKTILKKDIIKFPNIFQSFPNIVATSLNSSMTRIYKNARTRKELKAFCGQSVHLMVEEKSDLPQAEWNLEVVILTAFFNLPA